jgi:hypothetical protein
MRAAILCQTASARAPVVPHETFDRIELAFFDDLAVTIPGPPYDQLQHAFVSRRVPNLVQACLELTE